MTTAISNAQLMAEWPLCDRGDGRIEIIDPKGVGHPSEQLSKMYYPGRWQEWMKVHGCSGLCSSVPFAIAESLHLENGK